MLGKIKPDLQQNLFKTRLTDLINLGHPLIKLADEVSLDKMELEFQNLYSEQGRPRIPIRKIAGLLLLKEMFKHFQPLTCRLLKCMPMLYQKSLPKAVNLSFKAVSFRAKDMKVVAM